MRRFKSIALGCLLFALLVAVLIFSADLGSSKFIYVDF
jgi:hypothetical protein